MSNQELFPPEVGKLDSPRLAWQKRVVAELEIFTHYCKDGHWMAFSFAKAKEALKGYELTEEERTEPMMLFAAYCRLLDDAGMVADGEASEFDAICFVAQRHGYTVDL